MKIFKYIFCSIGLFIGTVFLGMGLLISFTSKVNKVDRIDTTAKIVSIEKERKLLW